VISLGETQIDKFGKLIVNYCANVKPKDEVNIITTPASIEAARSIYKYTVMSGGYPRVILNDDYMTELFYRFAPEELLTHYSRIDEFMLENIDVSIRIIAPLHSKPLVNIDPNRLSLRDKATRKLSEIFMRRDGEGSLRWVVTIYPTPASSQEANMSPIEWEELVFNALKLTHPDPVKAWQEQAAAQERIIEKISKIKELRIVGPGTDLYLRVDNRKWINDDGKNNMPGGEVFTAPIEDSVEGKILFDIPSLWRGSEIRNVKLVFSKGEVVDYDAEVGKSLLEKILSVDEGARRLGEFAFGLNYDINKPSKVILLDEKIGGTIHMALGAAYLSTGGTNTSSIHWDMIKNMKNNAVIYGDGEVIYKDGLFLL
jgi:aminopeptidase